jgi:CheY-like chemotaxis protein
VATSDLKSALVVDHNHDERVAIRNTLEARGYFVISSANGADALTMLASMTTPSMIVLGTEIPILDEEGIIAALQKDPKLAVIPVVYLAREGTSKRPDVCCTVPGPFNASSFVKAIDNCPKLK